VRRSAFGIGIVAALALACVIPLSVSAHPVRTAQGHAAEDSERVGPSKAKRLAHRTRAATRADAARAAAAVAGDAGDVGQWGPVVNWPVVAIHMALMPDGKVLAYDASGDILSNGNHTFTRATVWDPANGLQEAVTVIGFNIFCSGLAHLMDGTLFTAGGNKNNALDGIRQTHTFDYATKTWTRGADMVEERWYPSVTPLSNGEMLISDGITGRVDAPEVRRTNGTLRTLSTAKRDLPNYPWLDVGPDGSTVYTGPSNHLRRLDTSGTGRWTDYGGRDSLGRGYGSRAMYDIGKILVAGGGPSSRTATVVNANGATPTATATGQMQTGRRQHNLTVLADGTVLATGGNSSGEPLVDMQNGVYTAELWNPATGQWRTLAPMQVTRQYHSSALLLPDGRVLSAGGGICGRCTDVGYMAKNAEVFTPPYLFKHDGSGQLAPRPTITSVPGVVEYGAQFSVGTPQASSIGKAAMVRLGAVTHSVNMEQRYVPLTFTRATGSITATAPANANIAPPGVYMLFILDSNGVPSVSRMVRIEGDDAPPPPPPPPPTGAPTITDTDPDSPSKVNGPKVKGTWTGGGTVRIYGDATCTGPVLGTGSAAIFTSTGILSTVPSDQTTQLRARATSTSGAVSPCSAAFPYTEDSTPPDTAFTERPSDPTTDRTPTFAFTSTEPGSTFQCRIFDEPFAPCTSPTTRTVPVGRHAFRVRSIDRAGNIDPAAAVAWFTVN
jgi:Domain of unknown function (DUF1929)/Kelch motif